MNRSQGRRGFVMVLVLVLVAALVIVVVGQLSVVRNQNLTAVRDNDQVQARAIAERCLKRAQAYVDQVKDERRPVDWDFVLDPDLDSHPNGNGGSNKLTDDFVPTSAFGGDVVYVPSSEASATGLRQALHRWRLVDMDGGACLVRFDDNTDDFRSGGGNDNATPRFENNGKDIPFRDRDAGIFVNAIGIYPKAAATAAADAYDKSRARVAIKTFIGTGASPGIVARQALTMQTGTALCGLGGLQANTVGYAGGGSASSNCACGDTTTTGSTTNHPPDCSTSTAPGNTCDPTLACQPGSSNVAAQPTPDVKVPTPVDWLELEGFQDPNLPRGLHDNNVCEFYFRMRNTDQTWDSNPLNLAVTNTVASTFMAGHSDTGEIFVFDHTDDDAQGCEDNNTLTACSPGRLVTHNCKLQSDYTYTVDGKPVVKRPCAWNGGTDATVTPANRGPTVQCSDPATMTPCWKLVSRVRSTTSSSAKDTVVQQDFDGTSAATMKARWTTPVPDMTLAEAREESRIAWTEVFSPNLGERIPNIEKYWGDPNGVSGNNSTVAHNVTSSPITDFWADFCQTSTPCTGCATGDNLGIINNDHWHFEKSPMCREDFITPSILVVENQARSLADTSDDEGRFHVKEAWGSAACASGPVRHTLVVQSHVELDNDTRICGVFSDCNLPTTCDVAEKIKARGPVIRAGGSCYAGSGTAFIGDFQCANIHVNASPTGVCNVGSLVAFNDSAVLLPGKTTVCPDSTATTGFQSCAQGICINASYNLVGDMISDGDVCIRSNANVIGSVLAGGDSTGNIFVETGARVFGQVVSEGHIGLKSNAVINNNGTGIFGARVTSGIRLDTSY